MSHNDKLHYNNTPEIIKNFRETWGPALVARDEATEETLAIADKKIKGLDDEISELEACRSSKWNERKKWEQWKNKLRALRSPIRKLPDELLSEILQHQDNLIYSHYESHSDIFRKAPMTVVASQVCFRWRKLVEGSPILWSKLTVDISMLAWSNGLAVPNFEDTIRRFLNRSGRHPLDLSLTLNLPPLYTNTNTNAGGIPGLFLLAEQAYRWKSFKYVGEQSVWADEALAKKLDFPLLMELDWEAACDIPEAIEREAFNRFVRHSPRLYSIRVNFISELPLSISVLNLDSLITSQSDLKGVLDNFPSLKSLDIRFYGEEDSEEPLEQQQMCVSWPNITSLSITHAFRQGASLKVIFTFFSFPCLRELIVDHSKCEWPTEAFKSFISSSGCRIQSLVLGGEMYLELSDEDLFRTLQCVPELSSLQLHVPDDYNPYSLPSHRPFSAYLLEKLTLNGKNPDSDIIANLENLSITNVGGEFDDHAAITMVQSRWSRPGRLRTIKSFTLKFAYREIDPRTMNMYNALRILDGRV
ncbi:hypothetical protein BDP27DRAFT_1427516 [Rhodocollybia butyracea]|uniref:F-box domain-containing protein n=1 Tax=Rhodocollybia butyracea TaxID=206335 RepID=A0A9P5PFC4_9AGAR|nr:hypothetical protein BDP27DRAFT_1427516 [Rhodocollybia butyracea]